MTDLFFSYDGQNYDWYLIMVSVMMANINETHPGSMEIWKKSAFSVAMSTISRILRIWSNYKNYNNLDKPFMKHFES